jgi:hypothetical protein
VVDIESFHEQLATVGIKFTERDFVKFLEFLGESGFLIDGYISMVRIFTILTKY